MSETQIHFVSIKSTSITDWAKGPFKGYIRLHGALERVIQGYMGLSKGLCKVIKGRSDGRIRVY